jgi:hypothetical protein
MESKGNNVHPAPAIDNEVVDMYNSKTRERWTRIIGLNHAIGGQRVVVGIITRGVI